jgi:2-polyprenyl-6-methoxyphenol hydroxylase-like FAD-dependent oxidoreductase
VPDSDVLIAGAGPVGLALAVELSSRGVSCTIADPGDDRRSAPRAKLTNVRSMEHMRRWGLASRIRELAPLSASYSTDILFLTRLTGHLLTRFSDVFATSAARRDEFPEPAQQIPQYLVEDVLRAAADASPLVTRLRARLSSFAQHEDRVTADMEGTAVDARYLVGCDGGRSTVRQGLGATMAGQAGITRNLGIVFRAPGLDRLHPHGPALHYWLVNRDAPGFMGPLDGRDTWWMIATAVEAAEHDPVRMIDAAVGAATGAEVLGLDPWQAHALMSSSLGSERVFLAGDAAHLNPPFGAHGMNMGIGDAVDLGWKLAATLAGWGGGDLLASYEAERRPLHEQVLAEAALNNARLAHLFVTDEIEADSPAGAADRAAAAEAIQEAKLREFRSLGLVLGLDLGGSPLVVGGAPPRPVDVTTYVPSARPGSLLPHAWLDDGSSLYDRLGPWFTLIENGGETGPFVRAAADLGVPLAVVEHDADLGAPLVLVRPDRVVAWRGATADPAEVLRIVTGALPPAPP